MTKELMLEIVFKDGREIIFHPTAGQTEKATRDFEEGKARITFHALEAGVENITLAASEIKAIIPRWVEIETESTPKAVKAEIKKKPPGRECI